MPRVSNNTLHRTFRRGIDESPAKFFRILRLAHGHWSLQDTDMSISQIAHKHS